MIHVFLSVLLVSSLAAEELPEPKDISKMLDDGTVQGFSLQLNDEAEFTDLSVFQRPGSEDSIATGAILYAIPAETGIPKTLHLRLSPAAAVGVETNWNFKKRILEAIEEEQFPRVIAVDTMLTLQFLRGPKGESVGTPITMGEPPPEGTAPVRSSTGCSAGNCFNERFTACKEARLESKATLDLTFRYEILGSGKNGCRVRSTFMLHPNENWAGKSMVCVYDNGKPFAESILEPLSCTGALAEAMRE
ncbi:MAG: hypothetical protein COB53_07385 [Elusimicrobia bacterium]|nr:MAG: hypothetical protein COB53_07385 [Elusimicrobiota bacterium]